MSTASSTVPSSSSFYPITKSSSVPDIHKNSDLASNKMDTIDKSKKERNNLLNTNSDSIESAITSPTGSLEQFEVSAFNNSNLPLTPEDATVNINNESSRENQNTASISRPESTNSNIQIKQYDTNSSSFRFRRHSSQSSIILPNPVPLNTGSSNSLNNSERICSSPINSLKMSSRVCQIKISEGIEPHLNHEIKSERDMQCTLKLKLSCDDLIINNEEDDNKEVHRIGNNSPNPIVSSSSILRNNSQSNMPSPSMSSCYSYSNSCSPTGGICGSNNQGFARCLSPSASIALNNSPSISNPNQISQNYFSQSPSPTRKLLITRRSMSPIPCLIRPNTLGASGSKRKFSDVESTETNPHASPKRSNNDNAQEFVQPLQIYTGNSRSIIRSQTSSPFSPLAATLSSPNQNSISSLIITAPNDSSKMQTNEDELKSIVNLKSSNLLERNVPINIDKSSGKSVSLKQVNQLEETSDKYMFKPIQLPPPSTSCNITPSTASSLQLTAPNNKNQHVMPIRKPKSTNITTSNQTATSFASLAQLNSPLNSPAQYICDSPISCSPCISVTSSSNAGEKPDSGYQSSIQNNSDSESCV